MISLQKKIININILSKLKSQSRIYLLLSAMTLFFLAAIAQDTFSIVAIVSVTWDTGSSERIIHSLLPASSCIDRRRDIFTYF